MPKLIRERALSQIDEVFGVTEAVNAGVQPPNGVQKLALATGIPYGTLRNAVGGSQELAPYRVVLVAKALKVVPGWLTGEEEKPGEPPAKTNKTETNTGPGRDAQKKSGTGPKRLTDEAAA